MKKRVPLTQYRPSGVEPQVSKRLRKCFIEAHTDATDAQGLALIVRFHPDLPRIRLTTTIAVWKRFSRARAGAGVRQEEKAALLKEAGG